MALLNKHNFKSIQKKSQIIVCKEYDMEVKIQALSLQDQLDIDDLLKTDMNLYIKEMVSRCCVDEDGAKIFSVDEVKELPAGMIVELFHACCQLNKLGKNDVSESAKN